MTFPATSGQSLQLRDYPCNFGTIPATKTFVTLPWLKESLGVTIISHYIHYISLSIDAFLLLLTMYIRVIYLALQELLLRPAKT